MNIRLTMLENCTYQHQDLNVRGGRSLYDHCNVNSSTPGYAAMIAKKKSQ